MSNEPIDRDAREDLIEALYEASVPDPRRIRETWADAILASGWVADLREEIAAMLDKTAEDAGPHYVYGLHEAARLIRAEQGEARCQHVSQSPWGPTQCALPDGHDERHAYSPREAERDAGREGGEGA